MAVVSHGENAGLQAESAEIGFINVAKVDGTVISCEVAPNSTVSDLIEAAQRNDANGFVPSDKHFECGQALLTDNGVLMKKQAKLWEHGIGTGSTVMMVRHRHVEGFYELWIEVDTSAPTSIDVVKVILEIRETTVVLDGVEGHIDGSIHDGYDEFTVKFQEPVNLRSQKPRCNAYFRATECTVKCRSGDYTKSWWFPLEGKLHGHASCGSPAGRFKGRYCQDQSGRSSSL